ncbi:MAG: FxsA family protein [Planctomycetota bacterium]
MFGILLILFVCLPFAELALLMAMAEQFSWQATFALVVFTGILGAALARWQGFLTLQKIQNELAAQRMPKDSLMDAGMILVAAALLLTPGIMTDAFGFSLLFPPCRILYRTLIARWAKGRFKFQTVGFGPQGGHSAPHGDQVIDSYVVESDPNQGT